MLKGQFYRELIDNCNGSVAFSVKMVCGELHISQSKVTQEFKSCYGMTILDYWAAVRLRRACALLSESGAIHHLYCSRVGIPTHE
jgi:AraC-like DNA-binding protein